MNYLKEYNLELDSTKTESIRNEIAMLVNVARKVAEKEKSFNGFLSAETKSEVAGFATTATENKAKMAFLVATELKAYNLNTTRQVALVMRVELGSSLNNNVLSEIVKSHNAGNTAETATQVAVDKATELAENAKKYRTTQKLKDTFSDNLKQLAGNYGKLPVEALDLIVKASECTAQVASASCKLEAVKAKVIADEHELLKLRVAVELDNRISGTNTDYAADIKALESSVKVNTLDVRAKESALKSAKKALVSAQSTLKQSLLNVAVMQPNENA